MRTNILLFFSVSLFLSASVWVDPFILHMGHSRVLSQQLSDEKIGHVLVPQSKVLLSVKSRLRQSKQNLLIKIRKQLSLTANKMEGGGGRG